MKLRILVILSCLITTPALAEITFPEIPKATSVGANGIPAGWMVVGDIQVPENYFDVGKATYATNFWPNGVIPFDFHDNLSTSQELAAVSAMQVLEAVANIDFRLASFDAAWITFRDSTDDENPGNNAPIGHFLGFHTVNIVSWNFEEVIVHELMHVLGFWHEQSRTDRNAFISIITSNITPGQEHNFDLQGGSERYGPYDFGSLMHYPACAFSVCASCVTTDPSCRTITVLPPNDVQWQSTIGTGTTMSAMDELTASFMYPESNWRFVDDNDGSFFPGGTFLDPWETVAVGHASTPSGGTLFIQPGSYDEALTLNRNLRIEAPLGGVTIGN